MRSSLRLLLVAGLIACGPQQPGDSTGLNPDGTPSETNPSSANPSQSAPIQGASNSTPDSATNGSRLRARYQETLHKSPDGFSRTSRTFLEYFDTKLTTSCEPAYVQTSKTGPSTLHCVPTGTATVSFDDNNDFTSIPLFRNPSCTGEPFLGIKLFEASPAPCGSPSPGYRYLRWGTSRAPACWQDATGAQSWSNPSPVRIFAIRRFGAAKGAVIPNVYWVGTSCMPAVQDSTGNFTLYEAVDVPFNGYDRPNVDLAPMTAETRTVEL